MAGIRTLVAALDRLARPVPPWQADPDTDLRYRTVALGVLFTMVSMIPYAALYAMRGAHVVALVHLLGLAPAFLAWKLKEQAARLNASMHVLASGVFAVIAVSIYAEGGLVSGSAPWLSLVPAIFALAGLPRAALVWLALGALYLCVLLFMAVAGHRFPHADDPLVLVTRVTDIVLLGVTFCGFILLLERGRQRAMREPVERHAALVLTRQAAAVVEVEAQLPVLQVEPKRKLLSSIMDSGARRAFHESAPMALAQTSRGRARILVAEDNPVNQLVARGMLAKLGYDTEVVANGELAVAALSRQRFDAVLMDCQMPVMDGFAATRAIRERERDTESLSVPIVAVTANAMPGDREQCLEAGMDAYLSKPVTLEGLDAVLSVALSLRRATSVVLRSVWNLSVCWHE